MLGRLVDRQAATQDGNDARDLVERRDVGCGFDPGSLLCRPDQSDGCLSQAKVTRARLVYGPHRTPGGIDLYPGNAYGVSPFLTIPGVPLEEPMLMQMIPAAERRWTPQTFESDRDLAPLEARYGAMLGATNPDLSAFRARGGKLIVYHGWADALLSPWNSIGYWETVNARMGARNVAGFFRLFMAPGVDHCRGGAGPDRFEALEAVMAWRERGVAPDRLIASGGTAARGPRTRPLCPHPRVARYTGTGSSDDAANFRCVAPGRP